MTELVTLKDGRVGRLLGPGPNSNSLIQVEGEEDAGYIWDSEFTVGAETIPVLFLDIDGVLNNAEWNRFDHLDRLFGENRTGDLWWSAQLDPDAVARLNEIIDASGALVVLSSTWRLRHTPKKMQKLLEPKGFKGEIIDRTVSRAPTQEEDGSWFGPKLSLHTQRGHEIAYWLHMNPKYASKYVILDDDSDFDVTYDGIHLADRHIKTQWQHWARYPEGELGLGPVATQKAIDLFSSLGRE